MMRLRLCRALWRWLARPLAVFKAGFWMRYWLAANERNEHLGDRIEQLQEDILILRQRFDEERMEKELAQAFAKSAYNEPGAVPRRPAERRGVACAERRAAWR